MAGQLRICSWNLDQRVVRAEHLRVLSAIAPDLVFFQAATPGAIDAISRTLPHAASGLAVRPPRGDDPFHRGHGCAILASSRVALGPAASIEGVPAEERALAVTATIDGARWSLASFHAPRGIGGFKREGKESSFRALARWMHAHPIRGVAGMDANSPKVDALDLARSTWWSEAERELLGIDRAHPWRDAYRTVIERDPARRAAIPADGPLAISHRRDGSAPCRYDHVYLTPDVSVIDASYTMHPLLSDHALVVVDLGVA